MLRRVLVTALLFVLAFAAAPAMAQTTTGVISGAGALTKTMPGGILGLAASNSYTGATIVNAGVVQINPGASINGGAASTIANGGGLIFVNGGSLTASASSKAPRRMASFAPSTFSESSYHRIACVP